MGFLLQFVRLTLPEDLPDHLVVRQILDLLR